MRVALMSAAGCLLLAACGGPETSQANNAQANISNESRDENTAAASIVHNASLTTGKVDGKAVMHERHEGMESIGKNTKATKRELEGGSPNLAAVRTSAGSWQDGRKARDLAEPAGFRGQASQLPGGGAGVQYGCRRQ